MTGHRTLTALLKATTYTHVFGAKTPKGVRPSKDKETLKLIYNSRQYYHLNNTDFEKHFAGDKTYYFFGTPNTTAQYSLVMVDIDVQKANKLGTTEGAVAFANHLKTIWPTLYTEPSTNGKGIHGYLLLDSADVGADRVNQAIEQLERYCRHQAKITDADIELVEIKGKAPAIVYDRDGRITEIKYGTFAKYPRNATLSDLQSTTVIDWTELHSTTGKYAVPDDDTKPTLKKGSGYTSIPDDFVVENLPKCKTTWKNLMGNQTLKGREFLVDHEDGAVFLLIALYLQDRKQYRHSVRTTLAFWSDLRDRGVTDRNPNHHRIKAMRDLLSARGCIDWVDHHYQPPTTPEAKDGICCEWRLDQEFADLLLQQGGDNVDSEFQGKGENLRPERMKTPREVIWARDQELFTRFDAEHDRIFGLAA